MQSNKKNTNVVVKRHGNLCGAEGMLITVTEVHPSSMDTPAAITEVCVLATHTSETPDAQRRRHLRQRIKAMGHGPNMDMNYEGPSMKDLK
eukprot:scaffold233464_cov23-Tisochrysis_lutea.AAC.1